MPYSEIMARQSPDNYRRQWSDKKYYPTRDGYNWEGFLEEQKGKIGPFVVILEREPGIREIMFRIHTHVFIGLFSDRDDGKLGRLCFGLQLNGLGFAFVDGLDPVFLQALQFKDGVVVGLPQYKVTKITADPAEVETEIAQFITWHLSQADDMCYSQTEAAGALTVRDHFALFFKSWSTPHLCTLYYELEAKLKKRHDVLSGENEKIRATLLRNEEEMKTLLNKPL